MSRPADPTVRDALLSAAEAVFAEHGVAAAKVEDMARRASVSKGAFYLHFDSKEDALRAVVESFLARCTAILSPPGADDELPSDPTELLEFCRDRDVEIFEFFWKNRSVLAILGGCQGAHRYLVESFRQDMEVRTAAWIELLMKRGSFRRDITSTLVSTLVCGAYHELVHKLVVSPKKPPIREWVRQTQDTFFRGLAGPELTEAATAANSAGTRAASALSKARARQQGRA